MLDQSVKSVHRALLIALFIRKGHVIKIRLGLFKFRGGVTSFTAYTKFILQHKEFFALLTLRGEKKE